jgi:Rieske Fe-S protein
VCPCHGGSFDIHGQVTGGPPPGPMNRYLVRVVDGIVEVGPLEKEA